MKDKDIKKCATQIVCNLKEKTVRDCVRILSAALEMIAGSERADNSELSDVIRRPFFRIPSPRPQPGKYDYVWEYLETVDEYETQLHLHQHLVEKFGEKAPSKSALNRHLLRNR